MSIEMMGFGELFDKCAAAPGGGTSGARGDGGGGGGGHSTQRSQARVRAAAPLSPAVQSRSALLRTLPQIRIGTVHVKFPFRQEPPRLRTAVQVRVRSRRTFVPFHFRRLATTHLLRCLASLNDRQFSIVIVKYVSSGCVILYFTDRKVAAVHCRCDIKAAACNKIERFRPLSQEYEALIFIGYILF